MLTLIFKLRHFHFIFLDWAQLHRLKDLRDQLSALHRKRWITILGG